MAGNKQSDDLGAFLDSVKVNKPKEIKKSKQPTVEQGSEVNQDESKVNLIESAIAESKTGRKTLPKEKKATERLVAYVTPSKQESFNKKRGLIPESKILNSLIDKYIAGEIDL